MKEVSEDTQNTESQAAPQAGISQDDVKSLVEDAVGQATEGLARKNQELLRELKAAKSKAREIPEGFDPEKYKALLEADADAEEARKRAEGDFDRWREELTNKTSAEIEAANEARAKAETGLEKYIKRSEVLSALASVGGSPELLMPIVMKQVGLFEQPDGTHSVLPVDAEGNPRHDGPEGSRLDLVGLLEGMRGTEVYSPAFRGAGATGGGAGGSGGPRGAKMNNPWHKETLNLSEQGRILKADPELARQLRAQAAA